MDFFVRIFKLFYMSEEPKTNRDIIKKWSLISFATEFGFIIALPLVVFALAGKWLDAKLNTAPWLTIAGIVLAIISTTIWLSRRIKNLKI